MRFVSMKEHITILMLGISALVLLGGCTLPDLTNRIASTALPIAEARNTRIGKAIAPQLADQGDLSGLQPLGNPHEAFAARMLLDDHGTAGLDAELSALAALPNCVVAGL